RAAASASIRPSWPPPRMPRVEPGFRIGKSLAMSVYSAFDAFFGFGVLRMFADRIGLTLPEVLEALRDFSIGEREHGRREQRRVDRTGFPDREGADGNPGR